MGLHRCRPTVNMVQSDSDTDLLFRVSSVDVFDGGLDEFVFTIFGPRVCPVRDYVRIVKINFIVIYIRQYVVPSEWV